MNVTEGLYGSNTEAERQLNAFLTGDIPVAVYGLGKIGLPLASVYAETCGNVIGVDIDPNVIAQINDGDCHITREPGLASLVSDLIDEDALEVTNDPVAGAKQAIIHVVVVPTVITNTNEPDLSMLKAAINSIGEGLTSGDIIMIESTVPPGTTHGLVVQTAEETSGLDQSEFGVAFCPERTSSGRALKDIRGAYPKVVGGTDAESTRISELIYSEINNNSVIPVSDATTAECVKIFEGLYRDVNIALANELATFTDEIGINIREAIEIANTQPFCDIHDPGPGVGGHCIPFYPYFMIESFKTDAPLLSTARSVNDNMVQFTIKKLREEFNAESLRINNASILILGLTYRPGIEEIRASPAIPLAERLFTNGADVYGADPVLDKFDEFELNPLAMENLGEYDFDGIVIVTPHKEFNNLQWENLGRDSGAIIIDGRDSLDLTNSVHRVYTIGSGYGSSNTNT